ncbi:MAG: hypothetical protein LUE99_02465 [Bacteroides sp.]|nr:hypothetical protein [Bacteroides sp.]
MADTINITDMYMSVLSSLSNDDKLDLIAKLTDSMRRRKAKATKVTTDIFSCFHKDWGGNATPEKIADELRKSRTFHRTLDTW